VVGDHLRGELLHLAVGGLGLRELAGVDVDLVGGDDDRRDLCVVNGLRVRSRCEEQSGGERHS
jgi:hypothetical protein